MARNGEKGTAIWDGYDEIYAEFVAEGDQSGNFIRKYERTEGTRRHGEDRTSRSPGTYVSCPRSRHQAGDGLRRQRLQHGDGAGALESTKTGQKVMISEFMKGTSE